MGQIKTNPASTPISNFAEVFLVCLVAPDKAAGSFFM
jgi:hypothetical protein